MKFIYEYRTAANEFKRGETFASSRDAAYAALKASGIRPSRVIEAPGFFNKLFGKGKRWIAIVVLASAVVVGLATHWGKDAPPRADCEVRSHLYGDPAVIQKISANHWLNAFEDIGDAFLARNGQPGVFDSLGKGVVDDPEIKAALLKGARKHLTIKENDLAELGKMKRIVNGMKDELVAYIDANGDVGDYMKLCVERIGTEIGIARRAQDQFSNLKKKLRQGLDAEVAKEWDKQNRILRSFGLATVPYPDETQDE